MLYPCFTLVTLNCQILQAIRCVELVLASTESSGWNDDVCKTSFEILVRLGLDCRLAVYKSAQNAVYRLLQYPPPPQRIHPLSKLAGIILGKQIEASLEKNDFETACTSLHFMQRLVVHMPPAIAEGVYELCFKVLYQNEPSTLKIALNILAIMFSKEDLIAQDFKRTTVSLGVLLSIMPKFDDAVLADPWLKTMSRGVQALARFNSDASIPMISKCFREMFDFLGTKNDVISQVACSALIEIVSNCICASMIDKALEVLSFHEQIPASKREVRSDLEDMIITCEMGLGLRFRSAWSYVLKVLQAFVRRLGRKAKHFLQECIELMGDFREDPAVSHKCEIDHFLGAAIEFLGPKSFLEILPLNIMEQCSKERKVRAYLIPIMSNYIKCTELGYFLEYFLPLATWLEKKSELYIQQGKDFEAKVHDTLYFQVWSLLPAFCIHPLDLHSCFSNVGPVMANALKDEEELRPIICAALHNLIELNMQLTKPSEKDAADDLKSLLHEVGYSSATAEKNIQGIAVSSKFFLPLLFNLYKTANPQIRESIRVVIMDFIKISDLGVISSLYHQILSSFQQGGLTSGLEDSLFDLCTLLIPRIPVEGLEPIFQFMVKGVDSVHERKCYKLLCEICSADTGREFIQSKLKFVESSLVLNRTLRSHNNSKKDRLRFLSCFVDILPLDHLSVVPDLLPEVIESLKEVNHVSRLHAGDLILKMAKKFQETDNTVQSKVSLGIEHFLKMLGAGIVGVTPQFVSASVHALALVTFEFSGAALNIHFAWFSFELYMFSLHFQADVFLQIMFLLRSFMNCFPASYYWRIIRARKLQSRLFALLKHHA
jgi:ribosomal RNA-processing protein 12